MMFVGGKQAAASERAGGAGEKAALILPANVAWKASQAPLPGLGLEAWPACMLEVRRPREAPLHEFETEVDMQLARCSFRSPVARTRGDSGL